MARAGRGGVASRYLTFGGRESELGIAGQLVRSPLGVLQIVNLEQADAALAVFLVNDRSVGPGRKRGNDGGFEIV